MCQLFCTRNDGDNLNTTSAFQITKSVENSCTIVRVFHRWIYRVFLLLSHILKFNNSRLGGPMFLKFCRDFCTVLRFFVLKFRMNPSTRSRDMPVCLTCVQKRIFGKCKKCIRLLTVLSKWKNAFLDARQANGHISGTRWRIRTKL